MTAKTSSRRLLNEKNSVAPGLDEESPVDQLDPAFLLRPALDFFQEPPPNSDGRPTGVRVDVERWRSVATLLEAAGLATEERGIPAREILETYMDAVRRRGGTPLRDWDRDSP